MRTSDGRSCERLPAADGKAFAGGDGLERETTHRLSEPARDLGDELRVGEVGRRLDDRLRAPGRVLGLVDAGADEVALSAKLHRERSIGRRRDPTRAEANDGKPLIP